MILGIDPGPEQSGFCLTLDDLREPRPIVAKGIVTNVELLRAIARWEHGSPGAIKAVIIEELRARGRLPIAQVAFDACRWSGRFQQRVLDRIQVIPVMMPRVRVQMALTGVATAGNPQVRAALIEMFGGSKKEAVGLKNDPGPLYGFADHMWSAFALVVAYAIEYEKDRSDLRLLLHQAAKAQE